MDRKLTVNKDVAGPMSASISISVAHFAANRGAVTRAFQAQGNVAVPGRWPKLFAPFEHLPSFAPPPTQSSRAQADLEACIKGFVISADANTPRLRDEPLIWSVVAVYLRSIFPWVGSFAWPRATGHIWPP